MTAALPLRRQPRPQARPASFANRLEPRRVPVRPRVAPPPAVRPDAWALRRQFKSRWARFLRTHWRNREAVAAWFEVTFQTACNWWDEVNAPGGDKVALAALAYPASFARIVGAGA